MTDKVSLGRCAETVYSRWRFSGVRCAKNAKVVRNGKGYCKVHDPEYIKAKGEARTAKLEAEWASKKKERNLISTALTACNKINPTNPQAAADSLVDMYGALKALNYYLSAGYPDNMKLKKVAVDLMDKAITKADRK